MRKMKLLSLALVAFSLTALLTVNLNAYCFSAWCEKVPQNEIFLNPVLTGALDGASYTDWEFIIGFGVIENMDFYFSTDGYGLIRYDVSGNDMAMLGLKASSADLAVEYHGVFPIDPSFIIEANVSYTMPYGAMIDSSVIGGIFAPVILFSQDFAFFIEFNPSYDLTPGAGFSMQFLPGFSLFDGAFTFGVPIDLAGSDIIIGYAAMFGVAFDIPQAPEENTGEGM
ncbi:MAG: hypothetical protein HPY53_00080 [Brevinematales bacterium]|nr:hypothetical protein [Brevinematales bacterium]